MRVAVVGSGVAGLAAAHQLCTDHDVTLFEAAPVPGGHVNTVDVTLDGREHRVDVGFVVFNERNYPRLVRLLDDLGVQTQPSEMSFSVSAADVEYAGTGLRGVFAQPTNALRPSFLRLLYDVTRFNRLAAAVATGPGDQRSVAEFVADERFGPRFVDHFLLPLGSAVWSVDPARFATTPIAALATFLHRHDFLRVRGRPTWRTVRGGAARYVDAVLARDRFRLHLRTPVRQLQRGPESVRVLLADGAAEFDRVVLAVAADVALSLLDTPTEVERAVLGGFAYTSNTVTLHHDPSLMPRRRQAWASWNYLLRPGPMVLPTVTYWMNSLQRLESTRPLLVTLNRSADIDPRCVLGEWQMRHPVIDAAALAAQRRWAEIDGTGSVHYCGAYWGSGFHEDGMASAEAACASLTRSDVAA